MATNLTYQYSDAKLVMESTYSNILLSSQNSVWTYIRADLENQTNNSLRTKNVLDRIPENLTRGVGFPYVIVPLPSISEERFTMTQKRIFVNFDIEVWIKNNSTVVLIDRVRALLSSNSSTFSGSLTLHQFLNSSGEMEVIDLPDESIVQRYVLSVQYEWIGDPA